VSALETPVAAKTLWKQVKAVVARLGIDADEALVTSPFWGKKRKLRQEIESVGLLADALRNARSPSARSIATELQAALKDIDSAQRHIRALADLHWPRRRLYEAGEALLSTAVLALRAGAKLLQPEQDVLAAAPATSKDNAASAETLFRKHMVRIWCELGGALWTEKQQPEGDLIEFLVACEHLMFGPSAKPTLRRWIVRNCRKPDKRN
jgi:hypothetical protein